MGEPGNTRRFKIKLTVIIFAMPNRNKITAIYFFIKKLGGRIMLVDFSHFCFNALLSFLGSNTYLKACERLQSCSITAISK